MNNRQRALEFKLSNLISLNSFQGNTISYKKYCGDGRAYRLGLTMGINGNTINADKKYTYDCQDIDSIYSELYDDEDVATDVSFNIYLQRLRYFNPDSRFQSFYGYGPMIGYTYSNDQDKMWSDEPSSNNTKRVLKYNDYFIGATISLGVEWFCLKNISLLAEYNSYFYFAYRDEDYSYTRMYSTNIDNEKVWFKSINSYTQIKRFFNYYDYVKLGVAIQF
ncbi:hypothetical protein KKA87_09400 [bacterium]|nr:hypothetical protein [bacterium]MBU1873589.1 hypothetical protein [bacterium]